MLAVTTFVSTDIAAVPLLWILPLALYLLTFVLAFSSSPRYSQTVVDRALPLLVLLLALSVVLRVSGPDKTRHSDPPPGLFPGGSDLPSRAGRRPTRSDPSHRVLLLDRAMWDQGPIQYPGGTGHLHRDRRVPDRPGSGVLAAGRAGGAGRRCLASCSSQYLLAAGVFTLAVMLAGTQIDSMATRFALLAVPAFLCLRVSRLRLPFAVGIGLVLMASALRAGSAWGGAERRADVLRDIQGPVSLGRAVSVVVARHDDARHAGSVRCSTGRASELLPSDRSLR